jgi:hypothetical protein
VPTTAGTQLRDPIWNGLSLSACRFPQAALAGV